MDTKDASSQFFQRSYYLRPMSHLRHIFALFILLSFFLGYRLLAGPLHTQSKYAYHPARLESNIKQCRNLALDTGPPSDFHRRSQSDRFAPGTKPVLIKNAKIWTGRYNGTQVVHGDIWMDKGIIRSIGRLENAALAIHGGNLVVVDAKGAWVTPGIVDVHSHIGVGSSPALEGAADGNSFKGTIMPWLRSLDGLNTHDDSYLLSISGGVTTSLVLPGSADAIGGQAFVIKLRETTERSPSSMLLEAPYNINNSFPHHHFPHRWRHIKHACGENPSHVYEDTRMDTIWAFREAYNKARIIRDKQDEYCSEIQAGRWDGHSDFPEDLQWEALVDVLRGRVKVNVHCYEAVDLDALVHISNEFKFPIAAFHHASEAYLVPDIIKKAYGRPPAVALFATFGKYKREAYRASEFAPRILAEHGLTVLMKSDHPMPLSSRYLIYEAQQAYYYGFPENLAIASVTSHSAETLGMGHRIGYLKEGWDADLVIWDSHPLALGATPKQVFIDGIPQLRSPHVVAKLEAFQKSPKVPNFDKQAHDTVLYDGLPPLEPKKMPLETTVFTNIKTIYQRVSGIVRQVFAAEDNFNLGVFIVADGNIICYGERLSCSSFGEQDSNVTTIDLEGGSISPGLVSFGSPLGLQHIDQEPSTNDGDIYDPLLRPIPKILGGDSAIIRAVDGLLYGSRNALLAYRAGVTSAITAPNHMSFYAGLGTFFSLGSLHKLEKGAVIQEVTGVHVSVRHFGEPSVSTQIATLRRLLLGPGDGEAGEWFGKVKEGSIPLIVEVHSADIIATLIVLKREVELASTNTIQMTITGGFEAHILAKELSEANVGVILNPSRPFPAVWEGRRIIPGHPLTNITAIEVLLSQNVTVGIGCDGAWAARNLPFEIAWAAIESGGRITKEEAFAMGSSNLQKLLGSRIGDQHVDLVATRGGDLLESHSSVVAIISPAQQLIYTF